MNLWRATIVGDSVVGSSSRKPDALNKRRAVSRSDIKTVAILRVDGFLTALFFVLAAAAAFWGYVIIAMSQVDF